MLPWLSPRQETAWKVGGLWLVELPLVDEGSGLQLRYITLLPGPANMGELGLPATITCPPGTSATPTPIPTAAVAVAVTAAAAAAADGEEPPHSADPGEDGVIMCEWEVITGIGTERFGEETPPCCSSMSYAVGGATFSSGSSEDVTWIQSRGFMMIILLEAALDNILAQWKSLPSGNITWYYKNNTCLCDINDAGMLLEGCSSLYFLSHLHYEMTEHA